MKRIKLSQNFIYYCCRKSFLLSVLLGFFSAQAPFSVAQTTQRGVVFDPPSNVRSSPNGTVICSVSSTKTINLFGSSNGWYITDACGKRGYIHNSQVRVQSGATARKGPPQFKDYPVYNTYKGKPVRVNLNSHPKAREYRDQLEYKVNYSGTNFAGHYTVVSIGCGSSCQFILIVDTKTGNVYDPGVGTFYGNKSTINSNLLILNPDLPPDIREMYGDTEYYLWENNKLRRL